MVYCIYNACMLHVHTKLYQIIAKIILFFEYIKIKLCADKRLQILILNT